MEYLFILLAVVCIAGQFSFTKLYQGAVGENLLTKLGMLTGTSTVGTLVFFFASGFKLEYTTVSLLLSIASGLITVPYYLIGIKVLSLGSLAIYSMFMMLGGMLVPFFYGVWFLNEAVSVAQIIGTVLLTLFIVLQAISQSNIEAQNGKNQPRRAKIVFLILCLIIFFVNGLTGVIAKAHQINTDAVDEVERSLSSFLHVIDVHERKLDVLKHGKAVYNVIVLKNKRYVFVSSNGIVAFKLLSKSYTLIYSLSFIFKYVFDLLYS